MMIIKYPYKRRSCVFRAVISFALALMVTASFAEAPVKNSEKSDKVPDSGLSSDKRSNDTGPAAGVADWVLHAEQWELTRSGESLLASPVLNAVINAWLQDKQKKIEIQYPGGEEGEFWVQELVYWLVSLGIPSDYMVTTPGSGAGDVIRFNLIK